MRFRLNTWPWRRRLVGDWGVVVAALNLALAFACLTALGRALAWPGAGAQASGLTVWWFQTTGLEALRAGIAHHWLANPGMRFLATLHLALDTLWLVPAYAVALVLWGRAVWRLLRTRVQHRGRWRRFWRWAWPRAVVGVAALDLLENVLTVAFLFGQHGDAGPAFHAALRATSWAKWLGLGALAMILGLALVFVGVKGGHAEIRLRLLGAARGVRRVVAYAVLHAYPLAVLGLGLAVLGLVPQTQEILFDLFEPVEPEWHAWLLRGQHITMLVVSLGVWLLALGLCLYWLHRLEPDASQPFPLRNQFWLAMAGVGAATLLGLTLARRPGWGVGALAFSGGVLAWRGFELLGLNLRTQPLLKATLGQALPPWPRRAWWLLALGTGVITAIGLGAASPTLGELLGWHRKPDGVWFWRAALVRLEPLVQLLAATLTCVLAWRATVVTATTAATAPRAPLLWWLAGLAWWSFATMVALGWPAWALQGFLLWSTAFWPRTLAWAPWFVSTPLWRLLRDALISAYRAVPQVLVDAMPWSFQLLLRRPEWLHWIVLGSVLVVLVLASSLAPFDAASSIGAVSILLLAISLWGALLTRLWVALPVQHGLGNWGLLPILWLLLFGHAAAPTAPEAAMQAATPAVGVHEQLGRWRTDQTWTDREPAYLVAAAGGGLRAAYWTASLLAEMDDRSCGKFGRRVLAASGVSGGSLGVALWAAQRRVWEAKPLPARCELGRRLEMQRLLARDFLAPVAASLLFGEAVQGFVPFSYLQQGRGEVLAQALGRAWDEVYPQAPWKGLLSQPFLQAMEAQAREPMLFLNATGVETGRRVVASNVLMMTMPVDPLFHASGVSRGIRLFTGATTTAQAVVHSARFPLVSPPGKVLACMASSGDGEGTPCGPEGAQTHLRNWVHLVDGGYFENSGIETLKDLRQALQMAGPLPPLHLIAITNDEQRQTVCPALPWGAISPTMAYGVDALNRPMAAPTTHSKPLSSEASSPLDVLLSVREARAHLELVRWAHDHGCTQVREWSLGAVLKEGDKQPALGWMLSTRSRRVMDAAVISHADAFESQARGEIKRREPLLPGNANRPAAAPAPSTAASSSR